MCDIKIDDCVRKLATGRLLSQLCTYSDDFCVMLITLLFQYYTFIYTSVSKCPSGTLHSSL